MKISRFAMKLSALTIALVTFVFTAEAQNRERFGISAKAGGVNAVSGQVLVKRGGASDQLLTSQDDLNSGDIVTTGRDTLATLVEGKGAKLADDPLYKRVRADARVPEKVAGLAYGDLTDGLPFAFGLAKANDRVVPPAARTNTAPLKHTLLYAEQDGNRFQLFGFVAIK